MGLKCSSVLGSARAPPFSDHTSSELAGAERRRRAAVVKLVQLLYSIISISRFLFRGAMVQRLAHRPFKAVMRVRFPLALPILLATKWNEQNPTHA